VVTEAEPAGEAARNRALAGPRRPVYGHDHPSSRLLT
jgi:hypothetical protein